MDPVINKTGMAVISVAMLLFCASVIVWLILYGVPTNSLHQSALSWAWTAMTVALAALGLNVTAILQLMAGKKPGSESSDR